MSDDECTCGACVDELAAQKERAQAAIDNAKPFNDPIAAADLDDPALQAE